MSQKDCAADEPQVPVEAIVYFLYEGRERLGHFIKLKKAFLAFAQDAPCVRIVSQSKESCSICHS